MLRVGSFSAGSAVRLGTLALLCCMGSAAPRADAGELRVFTSGAPADAQKAIALAITTAVTTPGVAFTVAMPAVLLAKLAAGEPADVAVMPEQALAVLERQGKIMPGSQVPVARVGVGVVVRQGAALPDIATVASLRASLLAAPSLVYPDPASEGSVAGKAIARMLQQMGIADAVRPKTTLRHAITGGVEMVARGEAALGLFNISEILPVKGITLAGPLPAQVQSYITFAAVVLAGSPSVEQAQAYIRQITDKASAGHWAAAGLEPVGAR